MKDSEILERVLLKINYDDFMAWCKRLALQKYEYALNYYKRQLRNKK